MSLVEELVQESGHVGELVSLGGIRGVPHRGRQMRTGLHTIAGGATEDIAQDNGHRVSALILNAGPDTIGLKFGNTYNAIILQSGDFFQIDADFPWTGKIQALPPTLTTVVYINEVSVP